MIRRTPISFECNLMITTTRVGLALAAALLAALSAEAALVRNLDTGQVVFFDDFEGLGSNVSQADYPDTSGDYDPVAVIGSWSIGDSDKKQVQVTNWFDPGPIQEDNYLRLFRSSAFSHILGTLSEPQTVADHSGNTIHFEWMMYVAPPETTSNLAGFGFYDTNGGLMGHVLLRPGGLTTNGGGLTYAPNKWMKVQMDYVIGADDFLLTIDGNSAIQSLYGGHTGGGVGTLRLFGHPDYRTYIDAIPEPGAILIVLTAVPWLLLRRRR
jgi:hypothetical protein